MKGIIRLWIDIETDNPVAETHKARRAMEKAGYKILTTEWSWTEKHSEVVPPPTDEPSTTEPSTINHQPTGEPCVT